MAAQSPAGIDWCMKVYTWGYGANGRLGHGQNTEDPPGYDNQDAPKEIDCEQISMLPRICVNKQGKEVKDTVVQITTGTVLRCMCVCT